MFFVYLLSVNGCSINDNRIANTLYLKHELISYRTENMKVFDLGNNMFEAQYFTPPIHYYDNVSIYLKEITSNYSSNDSLTYSKVYYFAIQ